MFTAKTESKEIDKNQKLLADIYTYLRQGSLSYRCLQELQDLKVLPTDPTELESATTLLSKCTSFFIDLYYPNPFTNALILTTISHAKEKGWTKLLEAYSAQANLLEAYSAQANNEKQQIKNAMIDYIKANYLPRLFRAAYQLSLTQPDHPFCLLLSRNWASDSQAATWLSDGSIISSCRFNFI